MKNKQNNLGGDTLIIGIQGGPGSFNEEACRSYCVDNNIWNYKIKYLYTTEKVLVALEKGEINRGIFAVENSIGGLVIETIEALARHRCEISEYFKIIINHCLLARQGVSIAEIDTIMSHPQALAQSKSNLSKKYSDKRLCSGEGDMVDQATVAKFLAEGSLSDNIAVLAPKVCAEMYELNMLDEGLQDLKENFTTFLFVASFIEAK